MDNFMSNFLDTDLPPQGRVQMLGIDEWEAVILCGETVAVKNVFKTEKEARDFLTKEITDIITTIHPGALENVSDTEIGL